ncbi:hypothetical protein GE061_014042 [Apolygus lucorum]|uniref:Uncharacterized protein n=1 Tax=Apolygus lucorum TaxID=248454 RepID=A0A8S9XPG7_APOLU|nr:hypothetical protein GE061_014042 [Apolygus lucorum]
MESEEDENVRSEVWENEDQNQMDFEQESVDGSLEDAASDNCIMKKPNLRLSELIQSTEIKKQQYEEILKHQLENITELQNACENVSWTLQQLPMLKEQNSLNFNQALGEMQGIKEKLCQLNELIELTVKIYDDNMTFVYSVREDFAEQQRMNEERYLVFDMDVQEFPNMSEELYNRVEKSVKKKRDYCWLLNNYLADVTRSENTSKELNVKIDKVYLDASNLNEQLLESESKLELHQRSCEQLKGELLSGKEEFAKKMVDITKREVECTETLLIVKQNVDETKKQLQSTSNQNIQMKSELATAQQKIGALLEEKQEKVSNHTALKFTLDELKNQERTLTESLAGLTRCKQMVVLLEDEVKSLEGQFSQKQLKSEELTKQCGDLTEQTAEIHNNIKEATKRIKTIEHEYSKISPDLESLKYTLQKRRMELDSIKKKTSDEIKRVQSEIDQMTTKNDGYCKMFEEYQNQFAKMQQHKELQRATLSEKYNSITQKEERMHSINEELEECKVESNDLSEQKKQALELKNQVTNYEHELSSGLKELIHINENYKKDFSKTNEMNSKQIEDAMKALENQKQEYLLALEEKSKEISDLETKSKELQTSSVSFKNMLRDATKQAELFGCEQSLLSTFAKWVFEEASPSVPTAETWVTSTSDGDYKTAGPVIENEDDFDVRDIRTVSRVQNH